MTADAYTLWLRLYDARMADWKTNEEQLAKVAAIIEEDRKEAAAQERTAIVAWLLECMELYISRGLDTYVALEDIAHNIERGEHHGAPPE